jgi:cytochrome b
MVEYALLLASTSFRGLAGEFGAWASSLNWHVLGYGVLALVALRIAFGAFRSSDN